jgi:hypothetical protein
MDTSHYPSLGQLARASAQLAVHNRRVEAVIDAQLDDFERLFRAAAERDWDAVLRVSEELASQLKESLDESVVRTALEVCQALRRDPSGTRAQQPLGELLNACRTAKRI